MTKPSLVGCSWPQGGEQEEESRIKGATQKALKEMQRGAPRGLLGRDTVTRPRGCTARPLLWAVLVFCESCRDNSPG